jgi:hypothetical protein
MGSASCDEALMRALQGRFQAAAEGGHKEEDMAAVVRAST